MKKKPSDIIKENEEGEEEEIDEGLSESKKKFKPEKKEKPKDEKDYIEINSFYYLNKNKLSLSDLKDGRRIFHNKTELKRYDSNDPLFNQHFLEFRQLLCENLMLKEDFSFNEEERPNAQSALFSTFVYEPEFIEPMIEAFKIKTLIIRHREDIKYNQMEEKGNWIKYILPKIEYTLKFGKFHSKLIMIKFPTFLRIIVPSANLTNCDWYFWGQIIWFQDFPLKNRILMDEEDLENDEDFRGYLEDFLKTFMPHTYEGKPFWTELRLNLSDYDFSKATVDLIASANGRFKDDDMDLFGVGRLKSLVDNDYDGIPKNKAMYIQCSSVGKTVKKKFFTDLYEGFNLTENPTIKILYPTVSYIESIPMGEELSSCLFLTEDSFDFHKEKFKVLEIKEKFKERKTVLHSKAFITGEINNGQFSINDNSLIYFGSHNFSTAAFGNYEKNDTQISVANYELGIIFKPKKIRLEEKEEIFNSLLVNYNSRDYGEEDQPFINNPFAA
ncbi:MAG: tyrosyl-DNA phosphodiesterase 1 [archaeon]|nr:tyrosyl-DNA phosphodiesterase 1 [archaeon]